MDGTISSTGNITGVIARGSYLEVNLDRGFVGSAEHRWGEAYYAVLSKQCPYFSPQPYVKFTEPAKFSSRDPEPYIQSKICVPVMVLRNELLAVLSTHLK